jgi:hypothetical protein
MEKIIFSRVKYSPNRKQEIHKFSFAITRNEAFLKSENFCLDGEKARTLCVFREKQESDDDIEYLLRLFSIHISTAGHLLAIGRCDRYKYFR